VKRKSKTVNEIGRRLEYVRESRGLTGRELGRRTDLSSSYISRVESGERMPGMPIIRKLAEALGVTPHWLETGDYEGDFVYLTDIERQKLLPILSSASVEDGDLADLYYRIQEGADQLVR